MVRDVVPEIEVKWLDEVKRGEYLGVKINALETFIGVSGKETRDAERALKKKVKEQERGVENEDEIDIDESGG